MITEADTCRKYVLPKLYAAGWNDDQISEQKTFTDGRIIVAGSKVYRRPQKRADYLLRYRSSLMLAVVVPNGTLFGDGVCARIKEELLKEFKLHTIVRLPNGVFSPYTSIPTNILFFDRSGPTKEVWYYEHPLPEGRKNYTKTQPIQFDEFAPCLSWWKNREENDRAWKVDADELLAGGCNLDGKNPRGKEDIAHLPPEQLVASILQKEQRIAEIMVEIQKLLEKKT